MRKRKAKLYAIYNAVDELIYTTNKWKNIEKWFHSNKAKLIKKVNTQDKLGKLIYNEYQVATHKLYIYY